MTQRMAEIAGEAPGARREAWNRFSLMYQKEITLLISRIQTSSLQNKFLLVKSLISLYFILVVPRNMAFLISQRNSRGIKEVSSRLNNSDRILAS